MERRPSVSVIIPVYNKDKYIENCMTTIMNQSLKELEIICIDDGSTDCSAAVIEKLAKSDSRISMIRQKNSGAGPARNAGINKASGEFIAFMDPDDYYPDSSVLEDLYQAAQKNKVDICGGSLVELKNGNLITDFPNPKDKYRFTQNSLIDYSDYQFDYGYHRFIYRTDFLRNNDLHFPSYRRFQDPPFFVAAMALSRKFYVLSRPSYIYRVGYCTINWDEEKLTGLVNGICDVLEVAKIHNLNDLKKLELERVEKSYLDLLYTNALNPTKDFANALERLVYCLEQNEITGNEEFEIVRDSLKRLASFSWYSLSLSSQQLTPHPPCSSPKASIIIPVHNTEQYILPCLKSAVCQTMEEIEIIIVDDGSTDHSIQLISEIALQDKRIVIIKKENGGLSSARNAGLDISRGKYILFLDSDDMLELDAVRILYDEAEQNQLDQLFYSAESFYDSFFTMKEHFGYATYYDYKQEYLNSLTGQELFCLLCDNDDLKPSACLQLLRRDFLFENGISFLNGIIHEDNLFTIECLLSSSNSMCINERLYKRRVRGDSIMTSEKGPRNAFGYYCAVQEAINFIQQRNIQLDESSISHLEKHNDKLLEAASNIYAESSESLKNVFLQSLSPAQRLQFSVMVVSSRINGTNELRLAKTAAAKASDRITQLKKSNSYRIGRAVTFLPRKAKRAFRRIKNHALGKH